MRVMVIVKADKASEAGEMPSQKLLAEMGNYNEQLVNAGVDWLQRAPFDGGAELEIRAIFEAEDFGKEFTPELRAQEERLRAKIESPS